MHPPDIVDPAVNDDGEQQFQVQPECEVAVRLLGADVMHNLWFVQLCLQLVAQITRHCEGVQDTCESWACQETLQFTTDPAQEPVIPWVDLHSSTPQIKTQGRGRKTKKRGPQQRGLDTISTQKNYYSDMVHGSAREACKRLGRGLAYLRGSPITRPDCLVSSLVNPLLSSTRTFSQDWVSI